MFRELNNDEDKFQQYTWLSRERFAEVLHFVGQENVMQFAGGISNLKLFSFLINSVEIKWNEEQMQLVTLIERL